MFVIELQDMQIVFAGKTQQQQQQQQLGNKVGEIDSEFCQTCRKKKKRLNLFIPSLHRTGVGTRSPSEGLPHIITYPKALQISTKLADFLQPPAGKTKYQSSTIGFMLEVTL